MKLHLPCGLRKALLSVLALLSPLTATPAVTTIATVTLGAAALALVPQAQADAVALNLSGQTVTYSQGSAPEFSTLMTDASSTIILNTNSTLAQASGYTDAVTLQGTLRLGDGVGGGGATFQTNGDLTIEGMVTQEGGTSRLVAGGSFTLSGRVGGDGSPFEVKAGTDVSFLPTAALTTTVQKVTFTGSGDHTFTVGDKANLTLAQGIETEAGATTTIAGSGSLCVQGTTTCTVSTLDFGSGALKLETGMTADSSTNSAVKTLTLTGEADLTISSARLTLGSVEGIAFGSNTVTARNISLYGAASGVKLTTFADGMIDLGDDSSSASSSSLVTLTDVRLETSKLVVTGVREVSGTSSIYVTSSTTLGYSTTAGSLTISGGTGHVLGILETASGTADSLVIGTGVLAMFAAINDDANDRLTIKGNGELKQQINNTTGVTINSALTVESRASLTTNGDLSIGGASGTRLKGKVSVASTKTLTIAGRADVDGATLNAESGKVVLNTSDAVKATINTDTIELGQDTTLTGRTTAATIDTQSHDLTLDSVAFENGTLETLTLGGASLTVSGTTRVTINRLTTTTGVGSLTLGDTAELRVADHDINALLEAFAQIKLEGSSVLNTEGDLDITDDVLNKLSIGADATMKLNGSVRISASDPTHANALLGNIVLASPDTQDMEISGSQTVRLSGVAAHELYIHEGHAEIELTTGTYSEVQLSHGLTMKNGSELGITNDTDATELGSLGEVNLSSSKLTLTGNEDVQDVLKTKDINLSNSDLKIQALKLSTATSDPGAINVNGDSRLVLIDAALAGYQVLVNSTRTETTMDPAVDLGGAVSFNTLTVLNGGVVLQGTTTGNIALNSAGASLDLEGKLVGKLTLGGGTLNVKADAGTDRADGSAMTVQALNAGGTIALAKDITIHSLAGNGTLRVEGADKTLTLAAAGTHTGDITLADSVNLTTGVNNALGSAGTLKVQGNSTLTLAGDEDKNIDITGALTIEGTADVQTISGSISGGQLVVDARGLILTGELSLTQTSIEAGKGLDLANNRAASLGAVTNDGTLVLNSTDATTTTADSLSSSGEVTIGDRDTLEIAGAAVISGTDSRIEGTLSAGSIELSNTELAGGTLEAWDITLGSGITDTGDNSIRTGELTVTGNVELTGDVIQADETSIEGTLTLKNSTQAELGDVTNSGTLALASTAATTTEADSVASTGALTIGELDTLEVAGDAVISGTGSSINGTLSADSLALSNTELGGRLSAKELVLGDDITDNGINRITATDKLTIDSSITLENDTMNAAATDIAAGKSLTLTSDTNMGKLGTTGVDGTLTLTGTGTAPSTLTADIELNGTGSASLTNIDLYGSITTTNRADTGSTSLTLASSSISGNLTVVGGSLTLSGANTVGGSLFISDTVTVNNGGGTGSLTVIDVTEIGDNGHLIVQEDDSLTSAIRFNGNGATATFNGTHTQAENITLVSSGTIEVDGELTVSGAISSAYNTSLTLVGANDADTDTLVLSHSNTGLTADINSYMDTIVVQADQALGSGDIRLMQDQTLSNDGATDQVELGNNIDLRGKTLTLDLSRVPGLPDDQADVVLSGVLTTGSLLKTGTGMALLQNEYNDLRGVKVQDGGLALVGGSFGDLTASEDGQLAVAQATLKAQSTITTGENAYISLNQVTGQHLGDVSNGGTLELENRSALEVAGITNSGTLKLDATSSLSATGDVISTGTLTVAGKLTSDQDISISGMDNEISGKVTAEDNLTLANTTLLGAWLEADIIELGENITDDTSATRGNAFTANELKVTSEVRLTEDSILADQTTITGKLTLVDSTQAELGEVTNSGTLALDSTRNTTTTADSVENTGTLRIGATDTLEVTGEVSSTGTTATVAVVGTLTAKDIAITGGNATHLNSISGTVKADEDEGTLSLANTTLGSNAKLDGAGVVLESQVKTAEGATGVALSGDSLEVTGADNALTNAKVDFAESSIEADSSLRLTSNTDMGKLGTTTVEGGLTLEGTGTAPSTLTADITLNGTGSASLTNIALQGSISTTNTNASDAAEGSTSLTLKNTDISGDLTVVGGTLTLGGNNSVGGAVVISDVVTIVNNGDAGSADTPSLSVDSGTVIKANGELRVNENNSLDSAIIFDRYGLVEGATPLLTPTDAADPTATFTGTHTQNKNLAFASDGIINVMGSLVLNGHLVKKDLISQSNPAETLSLNGVTLKINSDNEAFDLNIDSAMQRIELGEDEALGAEGTLTLGNDQTLANNTQATTQSKDIDLNGKTLTVETGKKLELTGVVDNGSITKTGDAKLTLSNDSEEKTLTKLTVNAGSVTLSGEHYTVKDTVLEAGTALRSEGSNIYGDSTGNTGISGTNAEVLLSMDELDNAKLVLSHDTAPTTGATVTLSATTGSLAEGSSLTNERAVVMDVTLSGQLAINGGVSGIARSHLRDLDLTLAQDGGVGTQDTELGNVTLQEGRLSLNGGNSATGKTLTLAGDADDVRSISVLHDVEENLSDATLAIHADGSINTQENASLKLGSITGEDELTKVGVGTLTLTANNAASFTGSIVLREGTLAAQTSGAFGGSDAELVIAQNPQMLDETGIGASATPARLLITGTEGGTPVSYDSDLSVEADATLKTLSDTTWTERAQLSGAANDTLTKEGAAALILDSNSPGFATAIALNEGRLEVNGTIASKVTMTTGTTLNGSGTLGDVTGAADSSIYVGAAAESSDIATLTVGQYRANGAALLLDVTNAGADKLVVTAGADVSADTLKLHFAGDESAVAEQTRHSIVEAQGTGVAVSGDYGLRIEHNMDTRNAHTVNEGGDVILVLSKNHKGADKNGNQQSVSDALRDIERAGIATGELAQVLTALAHTTSEGQALAALDSLGGVNNTALMTSVLEGALDHTRNLRKMAGQNGATRIELKGSDECCRRYHTTPATELWFAPTAGYTRIGGAEGVPSFGRQGYGAMLGVDRSLTPELLLGLSCGYEYSKINITGAQKSTGDNYYLDLYGRVNKGRWAHSFSVGVGVHELMHKRNVGVAGLAPFAGGTKGDISGMSLNLSYEAAVNFRVSERATLAPVFTIDSTAAWLDSYTETGMGNAGLSVNRQDAWSTVLGLGARYSYEFRALTNRTSKRSVLTAQAMLTLDAADQGSSVKAHFIGAPGYDFTQNGPSRDRVGGLLSVGVDLPVTDSWSGFGGVSYELRNDYRSADGHIGVRYSF